MPTPLARAGANRMVTTRLILLGSAGRRGGVRFDTALNEAGQCVSRWDLKVAQAVGSTRCDDEDDNNEQER